MRSKVYTHFRPAGMNELSSDLKNTDNGRELFKVGLFPDCMRRRLIKVIINFPILCYYSWDFYFLLFFLQVRPDRRVRPVHRANKVNRATQVPLGRKEQLAALGRLDQLGHSARSETRVNCISYRFKGRLPSNLLRIYSANFACTTLLVHQFGMLRFVATRRNECI